ncbi:MAG TPA: hypothetical protein VM142_02305 [Acidimicrobiales bacterium]|nr:hypothetical protein [Acidimicrobiales bacterium]
MGEHGQCAARPLLVGLSAVDLGVALGDMGDGELQQLFHILGLRMPGNRMRNAKHTLVSSRIRSLSPPAAHMAAIFVVSTGITPMLDVVVSARGQADDSALRQGVSRLCQLWPLPLMKLLVTVMSEAAMINPDEDRAVMALLEEAEAAGPGSEQSIGGESTDGNTAGDGAVVADAPAGVPDRTARRQPGGRAFGRGSSTATDIAGLARLVLEAAGHGTALDKVLVSSIGAMIEAAAASPTGGADGVAPQVGELFGPAVAEILSVRPTEPGSWFLLGMVDALGPGTGPVSLSQANEELEYYRFLGLLCGMTRRPPAGEGPTLLDLLESHRGSAERLVESPEGTHLSGPLLGALVEADPRWAAELLAVCPLPFTGWERVLSLLRRRAAALVEEGDMITAELLLRSADEALGSWTVASDDAADELGDDMQAEAAQLCLLRITCRRARRDFAGAARLMTDLPDKQLPKADQVLAHCERALIAADLANVAELRFPRSGRDRRNLLVRLDHARRHVEELLDADPDNLLGRLLSGMRALCMEDDATAARDLGFAEAAMIGTPGCEALLAGTRFHRALCQLRLLEPGTDESAFRQLRSAMADGYDPVPEWLMAEAEALDAHESPLVGEAVALAAAAAPSDPTVTAMVCGHARRGTSGAVELAQQLGGDRSRSLVSRFALLEAALDGTGSDGQRPLVEELVDEIDDVVVRACDPALDDRWADLLGRHEGLRLLLDPFHADLLRVDVLRRVGRVEEARELARGLFYRAAAGGVGGVDAGEVLDLVAELGTGGEDLALLRPLVRATGEPLNQPAPRLEREVRILFVGGNEVQERYQVPIDATLAERYDGRVVVEWFAPGWGSNWMKTFDRIESRYEAADAVVLMPFVRTLFGRRVRKTAGEAGLPWIACTGHGRDALQRAIERAVAVVAGS